MKTLIVDDTAFMRMTLRNLLEKSGCEIIGEAENGEVGVNQYQMLSPELVTMDITMPVMDGITAIQKIKELDPGAKIIVVSAVNHPRTKIRGLSPG